MGGCDGDCAVCMEEDRCCWAAIRGSSGGGTSTICGTGLRSVGVVVFGRALGAGDCLCISGMLDVLTRLVVSSSLKMESNVGGTDELKLAEDEDTSRPAGLEKFVLAATFFELVAELEGLFNV